MKVNEMLERYRKLPLGNICDANGKKGCMNASVHPLNAECVVAGLAYTVKGEAGDNLAIHRAIYKAPAESVLVVDIDGYCGAGHFGEIMATACQVQKIAGLVIDGSVRDADDIQSLKFPVFACGLNANGTKKDYLGELNVPIRCGGVLVQPGDVVIGTCDGVAIIPRAAAEEVLLRAEAIAEKEDRVVQQLREGKTTLDIYRFPILEKL